MEQSTQPAFTDITWCGDFSLFTPDLAPLAKLSNAAGVQNWAIISADQTGLLVQAGDLQPHCSDSALQDLRWQLLPSLGWLGISKDSSEDTSQYFIQLLQSLIQGSAKSDSLAMREVLTMADSLPFLVSCIDVSFNYEFVNQLYVDLYNRPRESFYGLNVRDIIGDGQFQQVKPLLDRAAAGQHIDEQVVILVPQENGASYERFVDCVFTPRVQEGQVTGIYVCVHDQTFIKRTTLALQKLHSITASENLTFSRKIQEILELGCELFHLPFGIVSHVQGDDYQVEFCHSPNGEIEAGAHFHLGECYCVHTLERKDVTGFYHAGESEIATHPCYEQFKLEAYLGVSIHVGGEVWGTLNFSSPHARTKDFSEDEYELLKLFGQWVGAEYSREQDRQALLAAEEQHRLILASVHDGILGINEEDKITFANSAAVDMTGYQIEDLIGRPVCSLLRPQDRLMNAEPCVVSSAMASGSPITKEGVDFYDQLGRSFPVDFSYRPIPKELEQTGLSAVMTFQDVTEQQAYQVALTQQMELFRSLFMDAPEAIVVTDENRSIVMANPHTLSLFGYSEDQLVGRSPEFLYADKESFKEIGLAYSNPGSSERSEYRMLYRRADGSHFMAENVRSKILDKKGELRGFIIHARDISARLAIEADIEKARNRLSIATLSAGIGVWEMDVNTRALVWDEQMVAIYGIDVPIGEPFGFEAWAELVHPDDLVKMEAAANRSVETGMNLDTDFRINLPSGEQRYIKANAQVAYDEFGAPSYFLGVNYDITERYRTEAILKRAREEAIQASQAKSNFLATMSHEIRTPLNGVLGMAEVLASTELTDRQRYQMDVIRNSGENLLELINEILDFSKIEAGHLSLELADFDLEKLVFDLARLLVVKAEAKGVDLLVQYNLQGISAVHGDAYRIRQILTNLVGNAIKFTQEGEIVISVDGIVDSSSHVLDLAISVSDTGIGIPFHAQGNLFQAFTQADNSTTRRFGGTGLGLAITKQLVDLMGGDIILESEVGVGTTFTIGLSLGLSDQPLPQAAPDQGYAFERVLVVDDNDTNLSILEDQLKRCHINAEFENNALAAIELVLSAASQKRPYELIILDYLMPDMDGLQMSRQIRQQLPVSQWPKVLMISSAGALHSSDLREAGVQVCINKPTSVQELILGLKAVNTMEAAQITVTPDERRILEEPPVISNELAGLTVLVVEDMKANLAVAQGMLGQLGVAVEVAENGQLGVEKWLELSPDIILMDLHMPVMDGLTAIKIIRDMESGTGKRVPIFALTADIQPESMAQVEAAGGDGYISKPFKRKELLETISSKLFNEVSDHSVVEDDLSLTESGGKMVQTSVDESVLAGLEEVLGDQVNEIVAAFVHDAKNVFQSFHEIVSKEGEQVDLYRPAHSLKSVSANIGAFHLSELAGQLEKDAQAAENFDAKARIEEIWKEYERVCEHLRRLGKMI
ncbi:PAS domain S-box protein [Rhodanobacter aciditrophus]|uniref:histidine kinase n=1 Tax=Rhodanobacter aciditrophus TaxID=1623218 RepID=A0ABW4B0F2_9GAMM